MSLGLTVAAVIQTFFIVAFLLVIMPFYLPKQKVILLMSAVSVVWCFIAAILATYYGGDFLSQYGYLLLGLPLYIFVYAFSKAKGSRHVFIIMTILIFHRIISTLLMIVRVYSGGFSLVYFILNFVLFTALLYGGWLIRSDFHKVIFTYDTEFGCLSSILVLLLMFVWLFKPVTDDNLIDMDILFVALPLYLLTILLYLFIGISFRNFSKRIDAERDTLSLTHQIQIAQDHITLMQNNHERTNLYRHDLRHHLLLIGEFLNSNNIDGLRGYLVQTNHDLDDITPENYCQNEAANLLIGSFKSQAKLADVDMEVDANIPCSLSISNTELCALLSNALENALTATEHVNDGRKKAFQLNVGMAGTKLLLSVENPFVGSVRMENGLPQSEFDEGAHGFGTKSIDYIAEKHGGLSSFEAKDGVFVLRVVI